MLFFQQATIEDISDIVRRLADDFLGERRERFENPLPESYGLAFEADANNELSVALLSSPPVCELKLLHNNVLPDCYAIFNAKPHDRRVKCCKYTF